MPIKVLMPALSPTMTEGNLAKWHKKEGDTVSAGDVIAEIETDKATMEVEAVDEGTLGKIVVPEGTEGVKVNDVIALLLEEGEDEAALADAAPRGGGTGGNGSTAQEPARPQAGGNGAQAPQPPSPPAQAASPAPQASAQTGGGGDGRVFASPLARRMAAQAGLDLAQLSGSGPNGRIVKADIEAALAGGAVRAPERPAAERPAAERPAAAHAEQLRPTPPQPPATPLPGLVPEYDSVPHSSMRKVIARRMVESKQTVPHFYVTMDCEIDALLKIRKELNERAGDAYKLSVNDFVIRAAALALRKVPAANASWSEEATLRYRAADISVAVAIEGGLITPVIRGADQKGLAAISNEMKELAARARAGKLKPEEYQGGTFSVSNLGMYGVRHFEAIINPPQGCILAVGAGEQRPVVKEGALAIATVMSCTLSVDHRVVDGAVGAEYLAAFKKLIEDPLTMLL